jgi:hypothetical protein
MIRHILMMMLTLFLMLVNLPMSFSQVEDPRMMYLRQRAKQAFEKEKLLYQEIRKGWTSDDVTQIMGPPERTKISHEGSDVVEVWGYDGYEIAIWFRNGVVSKWFFKNMR